MLIRLLRARLREDGGFTLVELVAAMGVFALAAGSVLTVLVAGVRTAGFSRDRTLGKDLARQRIEEMRRLPFYQSYATYNRAVDLLDFYFPTLTSGCPNLPGASAASPGYNSTDKSFTCQITSLPNYPRFGVTVVTRFVQTTPTQTVIADPNVANPNVGYVWNDATNDQPPSLFVRVNVTTNWTVGGRTLTFTLESLIGEARLEQIVTQGSVSGSLMRANTAFSDGVTLLVQAGTISTNIYRGNSTVALTDNLAVNASAANSTGTVTSKNGAQYARSAPPDHVQSINIDGATGDLDHPNPLIPLTIATLGPNKVVNTTTFVKASIAGGLQAGGESTVNDTGADESVGLLARNEVSAGFNFLDNTKPYLRMVKKSGAIVARQRNSCVESTAPKTVTCSVDASTTRLGELQMIPVNYSSLGLIEPSPPNGGYLLRISFPILGVSARAKAAAETGSTAAASTVFNGTLIWYQWTGTQWVEKRVCIRDPSQSNCSGSDDTVLPATSSCVVTIIACIVPLSSYVSVWSRLTDGSRSIGGGGTEVSAELNGVLSIVTKPANQTNANSGWLVSVGSLKAQAVDKR